VLVNIIQNPLYVDSVKLQNGLGPSLWEKMRSLSCHALVDHELTCVLRDVVTLAALVLYILEVSC